MTRAISWEREPQVEWKREEEERKEGSRRREYLMRIKKVSRMKNRHFAYKMFSIADRPRQATAINIKYVHRKSTECPSNGVRIFIPEHWLKRKGAECCEGV
ncbi:hypothetical protein CBL_00424 [Carabus blaptoides fortunei]